MGKNFSFPFLIYFKLNKLIFQLIMISMIKSVLLWLISGLYIKIPPIVIHYNYFILQNLPKSSQTHSKIIIKEVPVNCEKIIEKRSETTFISYRRENCSMMLNQFWNRYHVERSSWR